MVSAGRHRSPVCRAERTGRARADARGRHARANAGCALTLASVARALKLASVARERRRV